MFVCWAALCACCVDLVVISSAEKMRIFLEAVNFGVVCEEAPRCETSPSLPTIPLAELLHIMGVRPCVREQPEWTECGTLAPAAAGPVGYRNDQVCDWLAATRRGRRQPANHKPANIEKKK